MLFVNGTPARDLFPQANNAAGMPLARLNHGAFGLSPRTILQEKARHDARMAAHPQEYLFESQMGETLKPSIKALAAFLGVASDSIALTLNSTQAASIIAHSLVSRLSPGDEILITSLEYPATRKAFEVYAKRYDVSINILDVEYPLHNEKLLADVRQAITARTRIAVFDHITSASATIFPVSALVELCQKHAILSVIDGAHAPGVLDPGLATVSPDIYFGSLHKWSLVPVAAGFIYASENLRNTIRSPIVTPMQDGDFSIRLLSQGALNYNAQRVIHESLKLLQEMGLANIWNHNHALVMQGSDLVADMIGSSCGSDEAHTGFMRTVKLPIRNDEAPIYYTQLLAKGFSVMITTIHNEPYLRLSAYVYNELEEYKQLGYALSELTKRTA